MIAEQHADPDVHRPLGRHHELVLLGGESHYQRALSDPQVEYRLAARLAPAVSVPVSTRTTPRNGCRRACCRRTRTRSSRAAVTHSPRSVSVAVRRGPHICAGTHQPCHLSSSAPGPTGRAHICAGTHRPCPHLRRDPPAVPTSAPGPTGRAHICAGTHRPCAHLHRDPPAVPTSAPGLTAFAGLAVRTSAPGLAGHPKPLPTRMRGSTHSTPEAILLRRRLCAAVLGHPHGQVPADVRGAR
jgi:hypothetical protein